MTGSTGGRTLHTRAHSTAPGACRRRPTPTSTRCRRRSRCWRSTASSSPICFPAAGSSRATPVRRGGSCGSLSLSRRLGSRRPGEGRGAWESVSRSSWRCGRPVTPSRSWRATTGQRARSSRSGFGLGLLGLTWALAREVWPSSGWAPTLAVVACAGLPVVLRQAGMFHPDGPFAFFAVLALLLLVSGRRLGWPASRGLWLGAALGCAALTRQSAPVVIVALLAAALVDRRRRPWRFLALAGVALAIVVGPWWIYQTIRFGNPIQSFLERPELMLDRQPSSFWVSFPIHDLITHPYRPAFTNELLPMFHAELWSDWFGIQHEAWRSASAGERFFASTQSVLGFGWDILALGGLIGFGAPRPAQGLARRGRARVRLPRDSRAPPRRDDLDCLRRHARAVPATRRRSDQVELHALPRSDLRHSDRRGRSLGVEPWTSVAHRAGRLGDRVRRQLCRCDRHRRVVVRSIHPCALRGICGRWQAIEPRFIGTASDVRVL